jgi:GTP-binding protein
LVHVLDCGTLETDRDPLRDFDVIEAELAKYQAEIPLAERPRIIALNKIDLPDGRAMADMVKATLEKRGYKVFALSAATREGIQELLNAMAESISMLRREEVTAERTRIVLTPPAIDDAGFQVSANKDGSFTVTGKKIERWVAQTDFSNKEAIGYLADRLARAGVEKQLFKLGAREGSEVRIGSGDDAVVFDWEPTIEAGAELLAGPRGEDLRIPWERDR